MSKGDFPILPPGNRLRGSLPKVGIRPTIDGRRRGVRESLEARNLDPAWIRRLGASGQDCFAAIARQDLQGFGASLNECMACWEAILPATVRHRALTVDLMGLLRHYQSRYAGAMYSGCGGGYLIVASAEAVPGSLRVKVRLR